MNLIDLLVHSILFGGAAILAGIVSCVFTVFSLRLHDGCMRGAVIALALSLLPGMIGGVGALWYGTRLFLWLRNAPTANAQDIAGGLAVVLFPALLGAVISAPLIVLNLIAIARYLPSTVKDDSNA